MDRLRDYLKSSLLLNSLSPIEIEPINRDFSIKNKYIYMSMLNKSMNATTTKNENENDDDDVIINVNQLDSSIILNNPLGNYIESHSFVILESILALDKLQQHQTTNTSTTPPQLPVIASPNKSTPKNEFHRDSLLMFCLNFGSSTGGGGGGGASSFKFKFSNFLMRIKLVFTELDVLKEDIKKCLDEFLNAHVLKRLVSEEANSTSITTTNTCNDVNEENNKLQIEEEEENGDKNANNNIVLSDYLFEANIDRVCYLKKPSNCKTIRLEQIKSSTDCFRAMVEFSRRSELNERPLIFVTCHANVTLNKRV